MGRRTKANSKLIESNDFLKTAVKIHSTKKSLVLCTICVSKETENDWILWESLEGHLRTPEHIKMVKNKKRETENEIAADLLRDSKENKKTYSTSVPKSQKIYDKAVKEPNDQTQTVKTTLSEKSNLEEYYQFQMTNFIRLIS